ncbi:hypothetical protein [Vibrio panuliri]|uniref:Outer membrane protein beta-barrel domain-containing protein n=1 Tax=Vibrio panuliri TaxID=1381081 RepID=A0A1Q9HA23_9VIBR|nr:hypothetical protein [Vibrio panuliri]KAB1457433.1 hypothetical protein F7O85_06745 [Vibrio panuliri]OLQ85879.1 hypothetical protein BIY22_13415 [Vibrio panuliri]OLQ91406.1 hypothetical protein BIY20_00940 [Vibrio panuliri]
MKKPVLLAALASTLLAPAALANNFNYNFLEFRTAMDPRFSGVEFNAMLLENVHAIARVDSQFEGDADLAGGLGFNGPINQFADVFGQALIHSISYPDSENRDRETVAEFNIGLRMWLTDQFEATTRVGRLDESSVFHAGIRFHSTQQLSLSAETRNSGIYGPQMAMSVRFQF